MSEDKNTKNQVPDFEVDDISALDEITFDIGVDATNTAVMGVNATMAGFQTRNTVSATAGAATA